MLKDKLFIDLYNKIEDYSKVVIFGAGIIGEKILNDINKYKPNVEVIGFIDNYQKETIKNMPIWCLYEFINKKLEYDLVIMSTRTDEDLTVNLFDVYNIPVLTQTNTISTYYRHNILNLENYTKIIDIFDSNEDKRLFDLIYNIRLGITPVSRIEDYHFKERINRKHTFNVLRSQYLENINKKVIKTVFDLGFNSGTNLVAFQQFLPNLEKVYGFEAIYDFVKIDYIEKFFESNKLTIVPYALGENNGQSEFYINIENKGASICKETTSCIVSEDLPIYKKVSVNVTTMDDYFSKSNVKPDFIKMDIEGSELAAIKGGINTITKSRPQLAVSIYHTDSDFVQIPLYLKRTLKNYYYRLGHYSPSLSETVLYAIPNELA